MEYVGSPTPDGTEGIVHVEIISKTDAISKVTDDLIGCIINYQKLGIQCDSCYGQYKYMLLLPVNSKNNNKYENTNIKNINATFYNFEENKEQTLELERVLVEPEKLTHQFLPCCMEDKEKRDNRTLKFLKSESEKAQSYVSKYSKTVGINVIKSREFCKQGNKLFGIRKSDNTSRAKFVALKFSEDEPGILEKCSKSDVLHPCGILLHGKGPFKGNPKYDLEVIGSYSLVNDKITYKFILDEDKKSQDEIDPGKGENSKSLSADCSSTSNGQNAAINSGSVPSGSVPSDSQPEDEKPADKVVDHGGNENASKQTIDNQANVNNTNKPETPGAVATNELNTTVVKEEGDPSGSSEQFEIDEDEPYTLENGQLHGYTAKDSGATIVKNTSVFSKDIEDKAEKIEGKDLAKSSEAATSSTSAETQVYQLQELKKVLEVLEIPLDRLREGKSVIEKPEEILKDVNYAQDIITSLKNTKVLDLSLTSSLDAQMKQLNALEECLQDQIRNIHSSAEAEDRFGKFHLVEIRDAAKLRKECRVLIEETPLSSQNQNLFVVEAIDSIFLRIVSEIHDSSKKKHNLQMNECTD